MKKTIERTASFLEGVSTLDTMLRNTRIIVLLLIVITALGGAVRGGHSTLDRVDPTFNPQIETTALSWKRVNQIISLPDGKILVSGRFNNYNGQSVNGLVRLNADGTLDTTFSSKLNYDFYQLTYATMMIQADGKILVLPVDEDFNGYQLIRLNADGSTDPTFNPPAGYIGAMAIDASGRIIVSGNFNGFSSIMRLNSDGSPDPTFQFPMNGIPYGVRTQNNKIILISWEQGIKRLNEDGTIDSTFIQRNLTGNIIVQPDSKILVYGPSGLRRLNANGSDDTGFTVTTTPLYDAALANDGKITVADSYDLQIKRFLADGTADSSLTPYVARRFGSLAVQNDGGVIIGDLDEIYPVKTLQNDFVRLLPDGCPDPTFNTGTGFQVIFPGSVAAINVQPDQKILLGGIFHFVNDVPRNSIARLNTDSTLDPTFQISTGGTANYFSQIWSFSSIRTQNDGKIVVTGYFDYFVNGVRKSNLVRLNSDGSIDPTFVLSVPILSSRKKPLVTLNDGKLLVGASRGELSGNPVPVKLTTTGGLDISFNANLYPQSDAVSVYDIAVQSDGKILVAGYQRMNLPLIRKSFLTRLNADGSLDATFQNREQLDKTVTAFVLLPNGKIVLAESGFTSNVLRLNTDGSVDQTFNTGTGADGQVNAMLLLSTGRILVGGSFSNFNGQPRGNLVQLNADGSVFTPVYNLNGSVLTLAVDANGRVFVGGDFTTIIAGSNGAERSFVAGLIDAPQSTRFDFDGDRRADLGVFDPANGTWSIHHSLNSQSFSMQFGLSDDKTIPADFDGDGKTDIAVFRPSEGVWYLMRSRDGFGAVQWGTAGDRPMAGDYDGDGKADIAVWRPSSAVWWILKSSTGEASVVTFGLPGDLPLSHADFDGDRKTDIAVWRPSEGNFYWLASGSANQYRVVNFGINGDIPAIGDYNGDGKTDLVVFRPAEGNWYQYLTTPTGEYGFSTINFGLNGDEPVAADYDGDGKTDIAVRRGSDWHILNSAQGYTVQSFGNANSRAIATFPFQ